MNLDLIRKLQKNTTVFGELPEEEKKCLLENIRRVQAYGNGGEWQSTVMSNLVSPYTYRIDPSWNPEPQPAEWIREKFEVCEIQTLTYQNTTTFLGIKRNGVVVRLSELIDLPDFVGCVFEGALNAICPLPKLFNEEENVVFFSFMDCFFSYSADDKPVTAKWAVFSK
jgi:hypothetical protein